MSSILGTAHSKKQINLQDRQIKLTSLGEDESSRITTYIPLLQATLLTLPLLFRIW